MTPKDQIIVRGFILLIFGAIIALLQSVLPAAAPIAVALYGCVQGLNKRLGARLRLFEWLASLVLAVLLWLVREPFAWILWGLGATMAGAGIYCLMLGWFASQHKP